MSGHGSSDFARRRGLPLLALLAIVAASSVHSQVYLGGDGFPVILEIALPAGVPPASRKVPRCTPIRLAKLEKALAGCAAKVVHPAFAGLEPKYFAETVDGKEKRCRAAISERLAGQPAIESAHPERVTGPQ